MTEIQGLTSPQVEQSRREHGANVLTPAASASWLRRFVAKFADPLIVVICVAAVLSIGVSIYEFSVSGDIEAFFEPVGIIVAIILATGLSFIFEQRAGREFALLNRVNDDEPVRVVRDGKQTEVPRRDIVVGDVILLDTGDEVPADATLVESTSLTVDESSLTGEPLCAKSADPSDAPPDATYASDRILRGTKVMEGHCVARVTAVGDATENGRTMRATQLTDDVRTPLDEQLSRLGRMISIISYTVAAVIIVSRVVMFLHEQSGTPVTWMEITTFSLQTLMIAVALVCVSIPEGLPMAVTLSLAYSMRRMLRTSNLVRRLHACETMGAVTVICTDKTGTLTQNRMQVAVDDFFVPADDAAMQIAVNSTARLDLSDPAAPAVLGNPTEGALLLYLHSRGFDHDAINGACRLEAELPFSTERKYMATAIVAPGGRRMLCVKGAPEIVMDMCRTTADGRPFDSVRAALAGMQGRGLRTLAFATAPLADGCSGLAGGVVDPSLTLTLTGVTGIADPVRPDVRDAIGRCTDAGIRVKIVTGDTPVIAREIARQTGLGDNLPDSAVVTGPEFEAIPDEELPGRAEEIRIIARARPLDKRRLVRALQQSGEVVAVTGDGTNDAPALKAAHVGLSMGDGTAVAKDASDITIIDNSFASIARAVMWGRSLYRNIQRFILFQMAVNVAACLIVTAGSFMGTQSPLTVTQMLWVNLIMDTFAAMALASLPPSPAVMQEAPRSRSAFIITPAMWRFIIGSGVAFFAVLLVLLYVFEHSDITSLAQLASVTVGARDPLTPYELTLIFTIFVFLQFWNLFNARAFSTRRSAFHLRHCAQFMFIVGLIFVGQILIVSFGGRLFNVVPLAAADWMIIIAATSPVLAAGEIIRWFGSKAKQGGV